MARKPATPARTTRKSNTPETPSRPAPATTQRANDPRRIMHEAAWLRMFGSTDAKSPFTR